MRSFISKRYSDQCSTISPLGIYAENLEWTLDTTEVVLGQKSPVIIHANVTMADLGSDISGQKLWKASLFGSKDPNGEGDRFSESEQILNQEGIGQSAQRGSTMVLPDSSTLFNVGAIGCTDWRYACLEFGQINSPKPPFHFFTVGGEPTLIKCQERPCSSGKIICRLIIKEIFIVFKH